MLDLNDAAVYLFFCWFYKKNDLWDDGKIINFLRPCIPLLQSLRNQNMRWSHFPYASSHLRKDIFLNFKHVCILSFGGRPTHPLAWDCTCTLALSVSKMIYQYYLTIEVDILLWSRSFRLEMKFTFFYCLHIENSIRRSKLPLISSLNVNIDTFELAAGFLLLRTVSPLSGLSMLQLFLYYFLEWVVNSPCLWGVNL